MQQPRVHHYVPQWYQRRFRSAANADGKLFYLDLTPERISLPQGGSFTRPALRRLGTAKCFCSEKLYTLQIGEFSTEVLETHFFGDLDQRGCAAVLFLADYNWARRGAHECYVDIVSYIAAQRFRTPKGLDFMALLVRAGTHDRSLFAMRSLYRMASIVWFEGIWEVFHCDPSDVGFIVTDHPVTTYNRALFPGSPQCRYPRDAPIDMVGTQTIFPLGIARCLVITNLELVRTPRARPTKVRENSRLWGDSVCDIRRVQTGRVMSPEDVHAVNFILKSRARRFVAADREEWLNPEGHLRSQMWDKLGDRFFLQPDPRKCSFTTGIFGRGTDGRAWGYDEYGRNPTRESKAAQVLRQAEFETFHRWQEAWDAKFGELRPEELALAHGMRPPPDA